MVLIAALFLIILPVLLILYEMARRKRCATLPPGPPSWPFIGNVTEFFTDTRPKHEVIAKLSRKYGDMMTLWFFTKPVIIFSSVDIMKQAYTDRQNEFSDRSNTLVANLLFDGFNKDIAFGLNTPTWQAKKRLFLQSVKTVANRPHYEHETAAVVEQVINKMLAMGQGTPIEIKEFIILAIYNMVMILAYGKRFDLDDPEFLRLCQMHDMDTQAINVSRFYDTVPFLQYLPLFTLSPSLRKTKEAINMYRKYVVKWYHDTKSTDGGEIECMTQALAKGLNAAEAKSIMNGDGPTHQFSDEEIMHMLMDIYLGSTSTTSATMAWIVLEMVIHPDIQQKCYEELCQVTNGRPVSLSDRRHLHYIEACINETLRHHSPVSLNLPHAPPVDSTLRGYSIPAGIETIFNIWAIHHDSKLWKDADRFHPENFLDHDGHFMKSANLYSFGCGRRICPGESFARNSIFLTFTILLQNLRLERVDGSVYDSQLSDVSGEFLLVPKPYKVLVKKRE